jgi:hypothetical protein
VCRDNEVQTCFFETHVSIDRQPMLFDLGLAEALTLSDFVHGLRVPAWP